ncbi:hypothetical protein KA005_70945 [bacterium]|nr:hypothetical protein [bacterium]
MEIDINATKDQIEEFKDSILWSDMVRELNSWKEGFNGEMMSIVDNSADENPSTASILLHMGDLNGRQKAVDYIISILDVFLSILETKETKEEIDEE